MGMRRRGRWRDLSAVTAAMARGAKGAGGSCGENRGHGREDEQADTKKFELAAQIPAFLAAQAEARRGSVNLLI